MNIDQPITIDGKSYETRPEVSDDTLCGPIARKILKNLALALPATMPETPATQTRPWSARKWAYYLACVANGTVSNSGLWNLVPIPGVAQHRLSFQNMNDRHGKAQRILAATLYKKGQIQPIMSELSIFINDVPHAYAMNLADAEKGKVSSHDIIAIKALPNIPITKTRITNGIPEGRIGISSMLDSAPHFCKLNDVLNDLEHDTLN